MPPAGQERQNGANWFLAACTCAVSHAGVQQNGQCSGWQDTAVGTQRRKTAGGAAQSAARRTCEQEAQLRGRNLAVVHEKLGHQHEGEQQLVLLEQRAAHVLVQEEGEVVVEQREPVLQHFALRRVRDGGDEQVDEPAQRVLVHRVDVGHVGDAEVQDGRVVCDGLVVGARLVDSGLRHVRNLLLLADVVGQDLGGLQHVDRLLVLQDVALRGVIRGGIG